MVGIVEQNNLHSITKVLYAKGRSDKVNLVDGEL